MPRTSHSNRWTSRIFDRFYRGKNAAGTTCTGLGLAIARWVAEQHGGTIEVDSAPAGGLVFWVVLPVTTQIGPGH